MSDEVEVRRATAGDYEGWRKAYALVAAEGTWIGGESAPPDEVMQERFFAGLEDPNRLMLVAHAGPDHGVVGTLSAEVRHRGIGDLGMLLTNGWRSRGLGSRMLGTCIDWCREKGCHKVTLEAWPHNERAIGLYRKFGFEIEGRRRRHWKRSNGELWDSVEMGLVLDHDSPGSPHPEPVLADY